MTFQPVKMNITLNDVYSVDWNLVELKTAAVQIAKNFLVRAFLCIRKKQVSPPLPPWRPI